MDGMIALIKVNVTSSYAFYAILSKNLNSVLKMGKFLKKQLSFVLKFR